MLDHRDPAVARALGVRLLALLDVREVVRNRCLNVLFGQESEQLETRMVMVVPCAVAGRETACDEMRSLNRVVCHGRPRIKQ